MCLCQITYGHHLEAFRNYSKSAVTLSSWISMDGKSLVQVMSEARFWGLFAAILFCLTGVFFLTNVFLGIMVNIFWRHRIRYAMGTDYSWKFYDWVEWFLPVRVNEFVFNVNQIQNLWIQQQFTIKFTKFHKGNGLWSCPPKAISPTSGGSEIAQGRARGRPRDRTWN